MDAKCSNIDQFFTGVSTRLRSRHWPYCYFEALTSTLQTTFKYFVLLWESVFTWLFTLFRFSLIRISGNQIFVNDCAFVIDGLFFLFGCFDHTILLGLETAEQSKSSNSIAQTPATKPPNGEFAVPSVPPQRKKKDKKENVPPSPSFDHVSHACAVGRALLLVSRTEAPAWLAVSCCPFYDPCILLLFEIVTGGNCAQKRRRWAVTSARWVWKQKGHCQSGVVTQRQVISDCALASRARAACVCSRRSRYCNVKKHSSLVTLQYNIFGQFRCLCDG